MSVKGIFLIDKEKTLSKLRLSEFVVFQDEK